MHGGAQAPRTHMVRTHRVVQFSNMPRRGTRNDILIQTIMQLKSIRGMKASIHGRFEFVAIEIAASRWRERRYLSLRPKFIAFTSRTGTTHFLLNDLRILARCVNSVSTSKTASLMRPRRNAACVYSPNSIFRPNFPFLLLISRLETREDLLFTRNETNKHNDMGLGWHPGESAICRGNR